MSNLKAMTALVGGLRKSDRIPDDGDAVVQICMSLAEAVDSDPNNASLWREYRQAEATLRELTEGAGSEFDDVIAVLQSSVQYESPSGTPHVGATVRGNS